MIFSLLAAAGICIRPQQRDGKIVPLVSKRDVY